MRILFVNARIILPDDILKGSLLVENDKIKEINPAKNTEADVTIDCKNKFLSPGFIDIHLHGGGGHDFMEGTKEAYEKISKVHLAHGTTSFIPTSVAANKTKIISFLKACEEAMTKNYTKVRILGAHLEGPYFNPVRRGAHDLKELRHPDKAEYEEIVKATKVLKRWTIACELPNALELGKYLHANGINASIGHSDACEEEVIRAVNNNYTSTTHHYNAMSMLKKVGAYRIPGVVEAGQLLDCLYTEIIADGHHIPLNIIALNYKIKTANKMVLVTDAMMAASCEDGAYYIGGKEAGLKAIKKGDIALVEDLSGFAGSVATTNHLIRIAKKVGIPLVEAVKMLTLTPATLINADKELGSIEKGKKADLIIFDDNIDIFQSFIDGKEVYRK